MADAHGVNESRKKDKAPGNNDNPAVMSVPNVGGTLKHLDHLIELTESYGSS